MAIEFTQYLMPNGMKQLQWIDDLPADIDSKARAIAAAGYRFEMELLGDYQTVSFTIHDVATQQDVSIELCENRPAVPKAITRLIERFRFDATDSNA